jgi:hypothetical protein
MPLETASFINQLEASNPASTDQLAQADEHLRLIKQVLKATFPNITGPVTADQDVLNTPMFELPLGLINIWFGIAESVPVGWAVCNGQTVARSDGGGDVTTPDLRDRVVMGAGSLLTYASIGGATTAAANTSLTGDHTHTVSGGSHTHVGESQSHALTEAQTPAHKHTNGITHSSAVVFNRGTVAAVPTTPDRTDGNSGTGTVEGYTSTVGSGQAHSHGLTINEATHSHGVSTGGAHQHSLSVSTVQPSIGLHYIMKV